MITLFQEQVDYINLKLDKDNKNILHGKRAVTKEVISIFWKDYYKAFQRNMTKCHFQHDKSDFFLNVY